VRLERIYVRGYRSLREVEIRLGKCTVIAGPNGVGKTNPYRAIQLVSRAAAGQLGRSIAEEGGMGLVRWAGARRKRESGVTIELDFDSLAYALRLALPNPHGVGFASRFYLDPHVAEESITVPEGRRKVAILERGASSCLVFDAEGRRIMFPGDLVPSESVLAQIADPRAFPVLGTLRALFERYRFYHHFATEPTAPMRRRASERARRCSRTTAPTSPPRS
jgi:predicted ATPase